MAIETTRMQMLQKQAAEEYLLLHPETDAEVVLFTSSTIENVNTVAEALEELEREIQNATAGSVTGVKGSAETEYRIGKVDITAENIGLGNVDNTSDADKPISTATQAALNEKQDTLTFDATPTEGSENPATSGGIYSADAVLQSNIDSEAKARESGDEELQGGIDALEEESGATIKMEIDSETYIVTLGLYNKAGELLGEEQEIDLPLESVVVGGSYDETTKKVILKLQDGSTIEFSVADLIDGLVSESDFDKAVSDLNGAITSALASAKEYADDEIETATSRCKEYTDSAVSGLKTTLETEIDSKADASDLTALETRVSAAETNITAAQSAAETAQSGADAAQTAADEAKASIASIESGATSAGKAEKLAGAVKISITGDATGSADFDGSEDISIAATLADTGVAEGTWSAVQVDSKGRVLVGAQVVEVGSEGQEEPSDLLATGGIFFKRI